MGDWTWRRASSAGVRDQHPPFEAGIRFGGDGNWTFGPRRDLGGAYARRDSRPD
jgi:hypothetical protein